MECFGIRFGDLERKLGSISGTKRLLSVTGIQSSLKLNNYVCSFIAIYVFFHASSTVS